jgi:type II secretory pathway pseudopilin PulG
MIELLTVIAIIAILAAIIFPVYSRAKDNANRGSDISSMNSLRSALQLYRVDQGGYPPQLLGYVNRYTSGPNNGQVIPAGQISSALFPKRVDSLDVLRPVKNQVARTDITTAFWPAADSRAVGSAPILDLNGDGIINGADDPAGARQANNGTQVQGPAAPLEFYKISGYDVAPVPSGTSTRHELRYSLFWSVDGLGGGSNLDDPRQLGYNDPPDSTVITWNSFFRTYTAGVPQRTKTDIVLFLGGGTRNFDSADVAQRAWRVMP